MMMMMMMMHVDGMVTMGSGMTLGDGATEREATYGGWSTGW